MRRFFGRHGDELERELWDQRPQPDEDLVQALAKRVRGATEERRGFRVGRLGLATAMSLLVIAALAGTGGLSYASSTVREIAKATNVAKVVSGPDSVKGQTGRSDDDDDDDDDRGHGGGGRDDDDDDDDGGGGGGGGGDDDDDDGDDDDDPAEHQYKEERRACLKAVKDAHKAFHRTNPTRQQHKAYHQNVYKPAKRACKRIGRP